MGSNIAGRVARVKSEGVEGQVDGSDVDCVRAGVGEVTDEVDATLRAEDDRDVLPDART